jgi:hypothetical protein
MARDELTPYREAARVGDVDAVESVQNVLDFANEMLTPALWSELERQKGVAQCDKDGEPAVRFGWLLRDPDEPSGWSLPRGRAGLDAARRLQREVCDVLVGLVQGDVEPAERFVESGGQYRCRIVARGTPDPPGHTGRKRTRPRADASTRSWQLTWEPTRTSGARAIVLSCIDDVLRYAPQLGRCEQCDSFYLRTGRWITRKRRFCSEPCSVAFHNTRKVAEKSAARARARKARSKG